RVNGALSIGPGPLTVRGNDLSRRYHAVNPALSGTITGLRTGESISVTYATTATFESAIGTYPITPTVTDPNGVLAQYTLVIAPGLLTILDAVDLGGVAFDGYIA